MEWELLVAISIFPDTHTPEVLYLLITSSNMEWELLVAISTSRYSHNGSALFIDNVIKYGVGAIGRHKHFPDTHTPEVLYLLITSSDMEWELLVAISIFPDTHTPEVLYLLITSSNMEWELLVAISTSRYSHNGSALFIDNVIKYGVGAIGRHKHFPDTHTGSALFIDNVIKYGVGAIGRHKHFQILTHRKCFIY